MGNCGEESCLKECDDPFEPLCGSDGVTYLHECDMENAACLWVTAQFFYFQIAIRLMLINLSLLYQSKSKGLIFVHQNKLCLLRICVSLFYILSYPFSRKDTTIETAKTGTCTDTECENDCGTELELVCGSDDITYPNMCWMTFMACLWVHKSIYFNICIPNHPMMKQDHNIMIHNHHQLGKHGH